LVVLDSDLRIVDLNPSAETSLGMPAIQIIGQNALDQFPEWQDMLALIRANRQEVRAETRGRADFTRFYDVKATPIRRRGRITGYLVLFRDMTDRWQAEQELVQANFELKSRLQEIEVLQDQLRAQATRDPLTSLYNRRYLEEILEKELARAERRRSAVAIIMMDADHFKHINDRFGHKAGDRALQALARIIQRHIRKSDIACRYGGEEFVIVMPSTGVETASERAEQIRHDFYTVQFDGPETTGMTSLSIGIATYPHSGDRGDQVLDAADQAMYSAKTAGGNRIQLHERLRNGAPPIKFQNPIDPAEKKDT
jgi:diguanylate cyclase (GGDEF)-like protein/PAS domain S-box-containing protein